MDIRTLTVGQELHVKSLCSFKVGPKGGVKEHHVIWHVTNIKTWKRDADRRQITLHHGLKGWEYVTSDAETYALCSAEECPAAIASQQHATETGIPHSIYG